MADSPNLVQIESRVLAAAFDDVLDRDVAEVIFNLPQSPSTQEVSRPFLEALLEEVLATDPTDDHSVGLCACGTLATIENIRLALTGQRVCPDCSGDGFVYDEEGVKTDAAASPDLIPEVDPTITCPTCKGKRSVSW